MFQKQLSIMKIHSKKIIFLSLVLMGHSSILYAFSFDCERMFGGELPLEQSTCHDMGSSEEPLPVSDCTDCNYFGCTSMSSITVNSFNVSYTLFLDLAALNRDQYLSILQKYIPPP